MVDKRFDAVFDINFVEFESFYIILQCFVRQFIKDFLVALNFEIDPDNDEFSDSVQNVLLA